jgi:ribosomal protein S18 acetylase RimI-like enzyme
VGQLVFRDAAQHDAAAIAALHAESWRSAYRGILLDEFLDQRAHLERAEVWRRRFMGPPERPMFTLLAEEGCELVGFACVFPDENVVFGSFLDNLHVAPGLTGKGIGRELLSGVTRRLVQDGSHSGLYLWVLEQNVRARRFYERAGAEAVGLEAHLAADGQRIRAIRCYWPQPCSLLL